MPHDREPAEDPEDRVQRNGDERDLERQLQSMHRVGIRDRRPERMEAVLERAPEDQADRRDEDHGEVAERSVADDASSGHVELPSGERRRSEGARRARSRAAGRRAQQLPSCRRALIRWKTYSDATSVLNGRLPAIRITAPNSPIARANASATPERSAGKRCGKTMRRRIVKTARAERRGSFLHLAVELDQHRLHGADDERQRHEEERHQHAPARVCRIHVHGAARSVQREQRQTGNDRRQGKRQVDQRVHEPLARKVVADERPRERRARHRVDRDDGAGRARA